MCAVWIRCPEGMGCWPGVLETWREAATLYEQIDSGIYGPFHIGCDTADRYIVEQFFLFHPHDIHRHLAGNELDSIFYSLSP